MNAPFAAQNSTPTVPSMVARETVVAAVRRLPPKHQLSVLLSVQMDIEDPEQVAALRFAAKQLNDHADTLMREAFEAGGVQ
ncbi:MAG: hypothetical protein AAF727_06120 [Pseudomonadota bacterium]